jgi:hypothetical protein
MTLFEYLAVGVAIVLSLSVAQVLAAVRYVVAPDRRYWVHTAWIVEILFGHIVMWWSIWSYRAVEDWNFGMFFLMLLAPGLLYVVSDALVTHAPAGIASWEDHFMKVRRWFFGVYGLLIVAASLRRWLLLDGQLLTPNDVFAYSYLSVGAATSNRRVQAVIIVLEFLNASFVVWRRFLPGTS